jgi:hypothetical protein
LRPLPQTLTIPHVLTLTTLDDVRALVKNICPVESSCKFAWQQFAGFLKRAANGEQDVQSGVHQGQAAGGYWGALLCGVAASAMLVVLAFGIGLFCPGLPKEIQRTLDQQGIARVRFRWDYRQLRRAGGPESGCQRHALGRQPMLTDPRLRMAL